MEYRDRIATTVEKELDKDSAYIKYILHSDTGEGELLVDGEKLRVPAYSFTEMSEIVRREFEKMNPIRRIIPMGFRGERLISDKKELEVYATGSVGLIEYRVISGTEEG